MYICICIYVEVLRIYMHTYIYTAYKYICVYNVCIHIYSRAQLSELQLTEMSNYTDILSLSLFEKRFSIWNRKYSPIVGSSYKRIRVSIKGVKSKQSNSCLYCPSSPWTLCLFSVHWSIPLSNKFSGKVYYCTRDLLLSASFHLKLR